MIKPIHLLVAAAFCGLLVPSAMAQSNNGAAQPAFFSADDPHIVLFGRYDSKDPKQPRFAYPGSGLKLNFRGTTLALRIASTSEKSALTVVLDHGEPQLKLLRQGEQTLDIANGLDDGPHALEIYKRTETWQGIITIAGVQLSSGGTLLAPPPLPVRKLLFLGDSVTCGVGVDFDNACTANPARPDIDPYHAYGLELSRRLDAQVQLVCYGGRGIERDYLGHTSVADGTLNAPQFLDLAVPADNLADRATWDSARYTPDGIVISLGTNDFSLQSTKPLDSEKYISEYVNFLTTIRKEYPAAFIFVTEGAIVTDPLLRNFVKEAAARMHDAKIQWTPGTHYPGNGCNAHPTKAQHEHISNDLEPELRKALHW